MNRINKLIHRWVWILLIIFCVVGIFYPIIGLAALVCMLAPSIVAIFNGRMWCGNFCPRGSFNDIILSKVSRKGKVPGFLKSKWFRLLFLAIVMAAFTVQAILAWGSVISISLVFVRMIIITSIITIILGIIYNQRTWCTICPMGTMAHYVSKLQLLKSKADNVNFDKNKCIDCRICSKSCPVGVDVLGYKNSGQVEDADCLKCGICVDKCPKKSLYIA